MQIAHADSTAWSPVRTVRGGVIRFKYLLDGPEGSPGNFSLVIADTDVSFKSPRHRHNFDQIRVSLDGVTNYGPRENIEAGDVVYFPEGTYYGPQDQELARNSSLAMVIQFGGASGNGYMSMRQLQEGQEMLEQKGRFEGGVFRRDPGESNTRKNQDAYEAIWEFQNGRPIEYPKPRVSDPIHFHAENLPWTPVEGGGGACARDLGSFTDRNIHMYTLKVGPGALHAFPPSGQARLLFVLSGAGQLENESFRRHSAAHLGAGEQAALTAAQETELLVLALPRFEGAM